MSETEINDLPNELLFSIFKYLKVKEKPPCRLVCKRFQWICDESKVTELVISNTIENINDYWFPTNEPFNHRDAIDVATFLACRSEFQPEKFLKRLYFKGRLADYQMLDLNSLTHIEQLTIQIETFARPVIHIDLPNLRIMHDRSDRLTIHLNTPHLQTLKCNECYFLKNLNYHSDTIKHIELRDYCEVAPTLKNIEYLTVEYGFENIRLEDHQQLKRLEFVCRFAYKKSDYFVASMKFIRKLFREKGRQLQIYFLSVKLENVEKLEEYVQGNDLAFQISNYDLLTDHVHSDRIEYNELMELVNDKVPDDLYEKYSVVREISVKGNVKDSSHFIGFLKSFRYLNCLCLNGSNFDQSFYDFLPETDQLKQLYLRNLSKPITSFDFLFKMHHLYRFSTEQDSRFFFDLAKSLFEQSKFTSFYFCYQRDFFHIQKNSNHPSSYLFQQHRVKEDGSRGQIFQNYDVRDLSLFLSEFINTNL